MTVKTKLTGQDSGDRGMQKYINQSEYIFFNFIFVAVNRVKKKPQFAFFCLLFLDVNYAGSLTSGPTKKTVFEN